MPQDVSSLTAALSSGDAERRRDAAERFAQMGTDAQQAAVALVEACAIDDDDETHEWVAAALEDLGPPPPADVARLAALAQHRSLDVAYWAATLLGRLHEQAASAVESLIAALGDHPEIAVRQRAAWALGQIGAAASAAREPLTKAAASTNPRLAALAREAIDRLES